LIKLYEVKIKYELDDDEKKLVIKENIEQFPELENIDIDNLKSEELPYFPPLEGTFHIGEYNFFNATIVAEEKSNDMFPNGVELISVIELEEINICNWPEEECPYCAADEAAPEDVLEFTCTCGEEIRVADNGWKNIECLKCGKVINRNDLIGSHGNYTLVDVNDREDDDSEE
jgi:hypothetical protein